MASAAHNRGWEGRVEIFDRESGDWISLPDFRKLVRQAPAVLSEYSYGYQERFVAAIEAERAVLEPFYTTTFILGCAESRRTSGGADLFLTVGDEEELWLIESDGQGVAIDLVSDTVVRHTLMDAVGGALGFERINPSLVEGLPAMIRDRLLHVETAQWELLVKAWVEQYLALLDMLLEVKQADAEFLLRHRERLRSPAVLAPNA